MQINPVSITINNAEINYKKSTPSFKMREVYFGYTREKILEETVKKFKYDKGNIGEKFEDITDYILTKYFGWYSPERLEKDRLLSLKVGILTLGMSYFMTWAKKESDRADAGELASIVVDRVIHDR